MLYCIYIYLYASKIVELHTVNIINIVNIYEVFIQICFVVILTSIHMCTLKYLLSLEINLVMIVMRNWN